MLQHFLKKVTQKVKILFTYRVCKYTPAYVMRPEHRLVCGTCASRSHIKYQKGGVCKSTAGPVVVASYLRKINRWIVESSGWPDRFRRNLRSPMSHVRFFFPSFQINKPPGVCFGEMFYQDIIILPEEAIYKKVNTGREDDRVFLMEIGGNHRLFYWMQDKNAEKDEVSGPTVNNDCDGHRQSRFLGVEKTM